MYTYVIIICIINKGVVHYLQYCQYLFMKEFHQYPVAPPLTTTRLCRGVVCNVHVYFSASTVLQNCCMPFFDSGFHFSLYVFL